MSIRVAIVENERSVRQELASLISETQGFQCVGAYSSGEQALREIPRQPPEVVLMDINLGMMSGVECTYLLKQVLPELLIVMLTVYDDRKQIFEALERGASGYLLKRTPAPEILRAIEDVHRGGAPMSSYIARQVVQSFSKKPTPQTPAVALSVREKEVIALVARGYINKEIAGMLGLTEDTVRGYLKHIYEKLHVRSRTEAAMKYFGSKPQ
ncbi:MAG: response regulator transcription factor [Verrucomicrobia bacterium]|jgi:DNA-binding NarL/FixJ family response regulator|nr:response regulator transcription factor [Verrucomicrobiota bacterium]